MKVTTKAAGGGAGVNDLDYVPPVIRGTKRTRDSTETKINAITAKYRKTINDRQELVKVASKALEITEVVKKITIANAVISTMQGAIESRAVVTTKQYVDTIKAQTDISIAAIGVYTRGVVDGLRGVASQSISALYDMAWQSGHTAVDLVHSALGNQTLEEIIRAHEAVSIAVVQEYMTSRSRDPEDNSLYPAAVAEILNLPADDQIYISFVRAIETAAELFYFKVWSRSAVTKMNIEVRDAIQDANRGMPFVARSNEAIVDKEAERTAEEYAEAFSAEARAGNEAKTEKWKNFMTYLALSIKRDSDKGEVGVNAMKYYGVPANMAELVINLKKGFIQDIGSDLQALIDQWNYYSVNAASTGASSVEYLRRAEEIKTRLEEDGADEIMNVIEYIRGNLGQVQELYPEIGFGQTEAYGAAEADYQTAIASLHQATAEGGEFYNLNDAVTNLIGRIRPRYEEYIKSLPAPPPPTMSLASGEIGATLPIAQEGIPLEMLGDLSSEEEESSKMLDNPSSEEDEEEDPRGRGRSTNVRANIINIAAEIVERVGSKSPERKHVNTKDYDRAVDVLINASDNGNAKATTILATSGVDVEARKTVKDYDAATVLTSMKMKDGKKGGRATKKRRHKRAAKKTRKGKRGKVGRMSRKTRKTTRGRKAKKAKKTRKTRRHN
jgi:hypothetical protein